jgi:hypothetical protein
MGPDNARDARPTLSNGHGPVVEMVTGGWMEVDLTRTFAFTARRYADGTVKGRWERYGYYHGDVVCFTIDGNEARIGTISSDVPSAYNPWPNRSGGFMVQDNGEGANDPPDRMSFQYVNLEDDFGLTAYDYCGGQPAGSGWIMEGSGNIQIISTH